MLCHTYLVLMHSLHQYECRTAATHRRAHTTVAVAIAIAFAITKRCFALPNRVCRVAVAV